MEKVKLFRRANNLSQQSLAEYLGVTQGFISQVEKGPCGLSESQQQLIIANNRGWDISMLAEPEEPGVRQHITNNGSISGGVSQMSAGVNCPTFYSPEFVERVMAQLEENRKMLEVLAEQLNNSNRLNEWLRAKLDEAANK